MKYALNLAEDGRILSVTLREYAWGDMALVEEIPEDNPLNYRWVDGKYIFEPYIDAEVEERYAKLDALEAQLTYTAMMTDTLLEV